LNSVTRNHGAFSGILCTGILGGAIVPLFVGVLGDHLGLRTALLTVFVTLGFILSVSWWARPLVRNQTIDWADLIRSRAGRTADR
jgi:MFS transporter, FHS family, L-fucose permease